MDRCCVEPAVSVTYMSVAVVLFHGINVVNMELRLRSSTKPIL